MRFLTHPPRFLFFTGKGGVGKTSLACATALQLAEGGARVLLVSTDPASNVAQVLDTTIGNTVTAIPGIERLWALEIDPEQAAAAYRERIVGPVRGLLPDREIASITEQLSGSCTTEIASFNEFTDLLADPALDDVYDHVVFDTAPTGHTIRLLQLPGSWTDFLDAGKGDASCLGPLAGLDKQRLTYATAVAALRDPSRTRLVLVTRAQASALAEVERTLHELGQIGIEAANLVVNGVLTATTDDDPLAEAVVRRESAALAAMAPALAALPCDVVSLKPRNMVGLMALRSLLVPVHLGPDGSDDVGDVRAAGGAPADLAAHSLGALVDELEADGHGVILCMGKGGVGKTTIATAVAVALARRGHDVHLTTTDPAAHLDDTTRGAIDRVTVSRIDPEEATREYRARIMATKGKNLDAAGRANLAEDLLSPCTEEVAVFQQFSRLVLGARSEFVVIDTAPTGHTLLLLDAAGSYHRDVARQMGETMHFRTPLMVLQDPAQTKVLLVTLPEPTPVAEARVLQDDLGRAGIRPWAWVVNSSLAAAGPRSPLLHSRAVAESEQLAEAEALADRVAVVPMLAEEPVGAARLESLVVSGALASG